MRNGGSIFGNAPPPRSSSLRCAIARCEFQPPPQDEQQPPTDGRFRRRTPRRTHCLRAESRHRDRRSSLRPKPRQTRAALRRFSYCLRQMPCALPAAVEDALLFGFRPASDNGFSGKMNHRVEARNQIRRQGLGRVPRDLIRFVAAPRTRRATAYPRAFKADKSAVPIGPDAPLTSTRAELISTSQGSTLADTACVARAPPPAVFDSAFDLEVEIRCSAVDVNL